MTWELERLLRSEDAGEMLAAALASSGMQMDSWQLDRVYSRPQNYGRSAEISARFEVTVQGATVTLVASTRPLEPAQLQALGAVRCDSAAGQLHVWAHPCDPELPGLTVAEDPTLLAQRLAPLLGVSLHVKATEMLVLRPLRRAVYRVHVESELGTRTLFLKVVRPRKSAELLRRYAACSLNPHAADAGNGLLVSEAAVGRPLTDLLYRPTSPNPGMRIDPQAVIGALHSLQPEALNLPARQPPSVRHRSFVESLVASGADRSRLMLLADRIDAELLPTPGPVVATHGDFHPANLFLTPDGAHPAALIDADTVGPGFRADDLAMFLAHLLALPSFAAEGYADVPVLVRDLWQLVRHDHDALDLPARTAACMVSLAPGARSPEQLEHYAATAESLLGCDKSHILSGNFTS